MAVGKRIRGARRERAGCRRGPDAVPAGPRLPALRRGGRRRHPGRLLDERAQAFEFAAIGGSSRARIRSKRYLDEDKLGENQTGSRLWGANYEYAIGEDTTLGATYMKWFADAALEPGRDGLNVFNVRAYTAPLRGIPDLSFEVEYASERNGEALDSDAWTAQGSYQLSDVGWTPTFTYRYAFFQGDDPGTTNNEAFNPLFLGFHDWGYCRGRSTADTSSPTPT